MKKNVVISAIALTIGIIFTSCGDVYNVEYHFSGDMYTDNSSNQSTNTQVVGEE